MNKKIPIMLTAAVLSSAAIFLMNRKKNHYFDTKTYDGKFSVTFSDQWKLSEKNELNENSNLEAINNKNGLCFIMFSKNKPDNISLEEYNESMLHSIEKENIIFTDKITINNKNVHIAEFNSYYENTLVHYLLYTLETENYYHQIMAAFTGKKLNIIIKKNIKL